MSIGGGLSDREPEIGSVSRILSSFDPDSADAWRRAGPLVYGTTPGSHAAECGQGKLVALIDGEIHNRAEIRGDAGFEDDAELVISAYRKWGDDFAGQLCGEFACALWDEAAERLILARDHLGMRPLYFWRSGALLLFASDQRALLTDARVPREIDEEYMAVFLSLIPEEGTHTLYRSIERVPPGHALIAGRGEVRLHQWWQPERLPLLRLARHEDYAAALREALDTAVGCRLPKSGPVAVTLSSGLDSTAIAALAARRLVSEGRRLSAYTLVFSSDAEGVNDRKWFADESPLAAEVASAWPNIDHKRVVAAEGPMLDSADKLSQFRGTPARTTEVTAAWLTLQRTMENDGCRTVLNGGFGNTTFSYDGRMLAGALLRQGRLGELAVLIHGLRQHGVGLYGILSQMLGPNLPPALYAQLRRIAGRPAPDLFEYSAINPELARRTGVLDRVRKGGSGFVRAANGESRALRLMLLNRLDRGPGTAAVYRRGTLLPTTPGADRRLIELCLSIPEEQFIYRGAPRSLIRTAMSGIVPDAILTECRRGRQGAGWQAGFRADRPAIAREVERLECSPLARRCLDVPRLRCLVEAWDDLELNLPSAADKYLRVLGRGVAAGQFLRRFEAGDE